MKTDYQTERLPSRESFVSIDPGVKACGVATWNQSRLVAVFLAEPEELPKCTSGYVVEGQYHGGHPLATVQLRHVTGMVCGVAAARHLTYAVVGPSAWKGNVPKAVTQARIWAALNELPDAMQVYTGWLQSAGYREPFPKTLSHPAHDVISAIGIGMAWKKGSKL